MAEPVLFGAPNTNVPTVHQFDVPVTIGSSSTGVSWVGYGISVSRPTPTTMTIAFPKAYAQLTGFEQGRFPATVTSQVGWVISTNNIAVDGTITLTSTAAGSATAPANGDVFMLTFRMSADVLAQRFTGSVA